jgi:uncharacterized protein
MPQYDQQKLIAQWMNHRTWTIVGASQDRSKYGYKVFRSLRSAGYTVYPVNPKGGELEGIQVYRSLADLPDPVEVVNLVVPPSVTERVVMEAHDLGLARIWMQPGAESQVAINFCREHNMQVVYDACAMVHARGRLSSRP